MIKINQNVQNLKYDSKMTHKYERQIKDGILSITRDTEVKNFRFLEQFNIEILKIRNIDKQIKLRNMTVRELDLGKQMEEYEHQYKLNLNLDDLELENLEVLNLQYNNLENDQLQNLAKFKKLHILDVSYNKVDLTHIHNVSSLTKLSMRECGLQNIDQISSLINLQELDLSTNRNINLTPVQTIKRLINLNVSDCNLCQIDQIGSLTNLEVLDLSNNKGIDLTPVCKLKSLTKLSLRHCDLKNIGQIVFLTNLEVLDISSNKINITPLNSLVGLIQLDLSMCGLTQLRALKPLINLRNLKLSFNYFINITELQYLKNITHLNLFWCNLVSICVLRPLVNLENLNISNNKIVYLDANFNNMQKLQIFAAEQNLISDFSSIIQHKYYDNLDEKGFDISNQKIPSEEELFNANKMRCVESPNIQLKQIKNQHKSLQMTFSNFKKQINEVMNNTRQSEIQLTANVVRLFQFLNQFGFE
ncbi:leucine-rich_repeat domain-containing protein [Hexamita inflata]|uniref:Leucine-rich repeat domain-containing protein n=1 Tax=Hexamita inflata TaxID=28002 RepID=A0AA86USF0_9EUKA|nr:leucine-rich repeat domain-containing protein [Hexamita inflata]